MHIFAIYESLPTDKYQLWETQVSPINFSPQMELCIECAVVLLLYSYGEKKKTAATTKKLKEKENSEDWSYHTLQQINPTSYPLRWF